MLFSWLDLSDTGMTEDKKLVFESENRWNKRKKYLCKSPKSSKSIKIASHFDSEDTAKDLSGHGNHTCNSLVICSRFPASCTDIEKQSRKEFTNIMPSDFQPKNEPNYSIVQDYFPMKINRRAEENRNIRQSEYCSKTDCSVFSNYYGPNKAFEIQNNMNLPSIPIISELTTPDDLEGIVERYRPLESDNGKMGASHNNDDNDETAFCDMPKLERQDIYESNMDVLNNFPEGERDMCNLEIEEGFYNYNFGSPHSTVFNGKMNGVEISEVVEARINDNLIIGNIDVSSGEVIDSKGELRQTNIKLEKHPFNVTLLKTSKNCYKIKNNADASKTFGSTKTNSYPMIMKTTSHGNSISVSSKNEDCKSSCFVRKREFSKKRKKSDSPKRSSCKASNNNNVRIPPYSNDEGSLEASYEESSNSDNSTSYLSSSLHLPCSYPSCEEFKNNSNMQQPLADICKFKTNGDLKSPCKLVPLPNEDSSIWTFKRVKQLAAANEIPDFLGFKDDEILSLSVKVMYFNMVATSASSLSFIFSGKEIILRERQNIHSSSFQSELMTPKYMFMSPVHTIEKVNANASHCFEQSVLDLGTFDATSTPAHISSGSIRSRRQLFSPPPIDSPTLAKAHEFSVAEVSRGDLGDTICRDTAHPVCCDREFEVAQLGEKEVKNKHLNLAVCNVTSQESLLVTKLAHLSNSSLSREFNHETTHLIVGEEARGSRDYLLAIAYRVYIVTIGWVVECLHQNAIISPIPFIPVTDEGPRKCIEPVPPPFIGFFVLFKTPISFSNYASYELTKTLCSMGGATLILDCKKLHEDKCPRFFIYEDKSQLTEAVKDECKEMRAVPISSGWVRASISSYRAEPIINHLEENIDLNDLFCKYSVPVHLLAEQKRES